MISAINVSFNGNAASELSSEPIDDNDEAATLVAVPPAAVMAVRLRSSTGIAEVPILTVGSEVRSRPNASSTGSSGPRTRTALVELVTVSGAMSNVVERAAGSWCNFRWCR